MRRVDLDELERTARAATGGPWVLLPDEPWICQQPEGNPEVECGKIVLELRKRPRETDGDLQHVLANSPDVTLALVARIRELESFVGILPEAALTADKVHREDWPELFVHTDDGNALYLCDARERLLMKGTVIP